MRFQFVIGANPELGGDLLRLFAVTQDEKVILLDTSNELVMPSSFAFDGEKHLLYVTDELNDKMGKIGVFSTANNKLELLQIIETNGSNPCHIAVSSEKPFVYVSHYTFGGAVCYRRSDSGLLENKPLFSLMPQESAHCVLETQKGFIVLNSLSNCITHVLYDSETGKIDSSVTVMNSPRQARSCGSHDVLIVSEEQSAIFRYHTQLRTLVECTSTRANTNGARNTAASLWVSADCKQLLVSNRGDNSLVAFDIDEGSKDLLMNRRVLICNDGICPRDFDVNRGEDYVVVNYNDSSCVSVYKLDNMKSRAYHVASVDVPAPHGVIIIEGEKA